MIPLWLFLSIVIPLTAFSFLLLFLHFVRNPLPFPDWGNAGFVMPDARSRQAVINLLRKYGLSPDFRVDTDDVSRAIYRSKFPFILDTTSDTAAEKVGKPDSFLAIVDSDPPSAALNAAKYLENLGYSSNHINNPDPSLGEGKLSVVTSQAFPGKMIVFRKHILKMGGKPPAWKDD